MKNPTRRLRRFSDRDRGIIEFTARYRIATKEVLHRLFFDENEPNAVTKVVQRLCDEHWLRKYPLVYPSQYLIPGKRTAQALGLPNARTLPLGPQSLPTEFAILQYATDDAEVGRLTPDELVVLHPWFRDEWLTATHCLRRSDQMQIVELLRVDLGGPADHVARKCHADIQARTTLPQFETLVNDSLFRVVVVTATTDKAASIQLALQGHLWPAGLRFHFAVVPQLLPLLPRCFHA
jgi:hypothetical protein